MKVPGDVSVITIKGGSDARLSKLRMTSAIMPVSTMVIEATVMLYDQMENKDWRQGPVMCPCKLRIGNST